MPFGDLLDEEGNVIKSGHERKLEYQKEWRKNSISQGYGKWLYERRKLRFNDAERFREALEHIIETGQSNQHFDEEKVTEMIWIAQEAIRKSKEAEDKLKWWHGEKK